MTGFTKWVGALDADTNRVATKGELNAVEAVANQAANDAAIKPDYNAAIGTPAEILNKPDLAPITAKLAGIEDGATADLTGAEISTLLDAEPNSEILTTAERTKLAGLEEGKFKGRFTAVDFTTALGDLTTANPAPAAGSTAEISDGSTVKTAIWDGSVWVEDPAAVPGETAASVKSKYESNANTNPFTDAQVAKLAAIDAGATDDQTGAEIRSALVAEDDSNLLTDAEYAAFNNRSSSTAIPGNNVLTTFTVNHGFSDEIVDIGIYDTAAQEYVGVKVARAKSSPMCTVGPFAAPPSATAYEVHALRG